MGTMRQENQQRAAQILRMCKYLKLSTEDIAKRLGVTNTETAYKLIKRLEAKGEIVNAGTPKRALWTAADRQEQAPAPEPTKAARSQRWCNGTMRDTLSLADLGSRPERAQTARAG